MILVFVFVKSRQRFVELRFVRDIFDPALEEIFSKSKIFALRFDAERQSRLRLIVHCGHARVPGHVPGGHVPKQDNARLQSCNLPEQQENAAPFRTFPGDMRLNEKCVREDGTKSAQGGDETELANLLAQIEI